MTFLDDLSEQLKTSMRAGQTERTATLRLIKSEIKKFEIDSGKDASDEDCIQALTKMAKQRRDSIEQFRAGDREDLAAIEEAELVIIGEFLPEAMSEAKMNEIVDASISSMGEIDPKRTGAVIGKVMGALKASGLSFDGKAASQLIRQKLNS